MSTSWKRPFLSVLSRIHSRIVFGRRARVLAQHLGELMPENGSVLDVGCGNGVIGKLIMEQRVGLDVEGIDILARPACAISMRIYDGHRFPFEDNKFDVIVFTDILHHTENQKILLREAARVGRKAIIIKDHLCNGAYGWRVLSFMDWIGNRPHGVVLPYNYLSTDQWHHLWKEMQLKPDQYLTKLGIYPAIFRPIFEKGLHFIARLPINAK